MPTYDQADTYPNVRFQVSDGTYTDSEEITIIVVDVPPLGLAYLHLTKVMDRYQVGDTPRLLESYTATSTFRHSQRNVAYLYDSALAPWAFLERGTPEDLTRPRAIAEAFVTLQQHDPQFNDGRLRDAYPADFLLDGSGKARLQLASSHTGNLAWAILALTRYYQAQGGERYREAAVILGEWISEKTFDTRGAGGFTGGADDTLIGVGITADQGIYRLELPADKYILTPRKESHLFSPASRKVTVKAKELGKRNFTVKLLTLSGKVKDRKGKPLAFATVSLLQEEGTLDTTVTDAKGKYRFSLYNPGTYTVKPSREGSRFAPESAEVTLTNGNRGGINFKEVP